MQRIESSGIHGRVGLVLGRPNRQGLGHMVQGVSGVMFWLQLGCWVLERPPGQSVVWQTWLPGILEFTCYILR